MQTTQSFESIYKRILDTLGVSNQSELADTLEIRQSSVSDAKRRESIPEGWLIKLFLRYSLNPAWVLTGQGGRYLIDTDMPPKAGTYGVGRVEGAPYV